ncbi:pentatricopeptide repeat-containing protein At1g06270 [Cornus florida]|uniref:pentatricopeptide repeat-containing protein At1g06270 n=1 Tax=Cornus florida TaxID=4283 RepID=UPI002896E183|nr:pentatricopeptide repeat-containing protein At1g06270 [Cornus florida]XP_059663221.1 pentatricopeptide repeat-containing protein At1g06270 [Cornus florida]
MLIASKKLIGFICPFYYSFPQFLSIHSISPSQTLEDSIRAAVEAKTYQQIPDLLGASKESFQNPNPFSFLSTFSQNIRIQIIDEILQSFMSLRPRSRPKVAYSCLISYTLQSPNPLPLALAILQRTLRSGCLPVPQTHLLLSTAWLDRRHQSESVRTILLEMQSIGYHPDCGTCNYLISSLCAVDQLTEAVKVLKGMGRAGCVPDLESYGAVIGAMCAIRKTTDAAEMMKEMVMKAGLTPRQEIVVKVVAAMRAKKEIWRAVEMIEFLEKEGFHVGFKSYELVVEGCLECGECVLAGKVVMGMTGKGFIPYIKVRQKVLEELACVGEWKLACALRHRFSELKS